MTGTQSSLDEFVQDSPQTIIARIQRQAREAVASQHTLEVSK